MNDDEILYVNTADLVSNRYQPRLSFADDEVAELAASIAEVGLLHPPLVRPVHGSKLFEIVSGERRVMACRTLGYEKIQVLVRAQIDHTISAKAALIENMQRVDLNPIEVAKAILALMTELKCTQEEIASKIGKKRSTVANFLRLLQLPGHIQEAISSGSISMAHAKVLLSCKDAKRKELFNTIQKKNLSVRQAELELQKYEKINIKPKRGQNEEVRDLVTRLERHFGSKVELKSSNKRGTLTLHFYSYDDLDRILELCQYEN